LASSDRRLAGDHEHVFAWLCFYETRTDVLAVKLKTLLNPARIAGELCMKRSGAAGPDSHDLFLLWSAVVLLLEWLSIRRRNEPYTCASRRSRLPQEGHALDARRQQQLHLLRVLAPFPLDVIHAYATHRAGDA
jgi:hypothetical protein